MFLEDLAKHVTLVTHEKKFLTFQQIGCFFKHHCVFLFLYFYLADTLKYSFREVSK